MIKKVFGVLIVVVIIIMAFSYWSPEVKSPTPSPDKNSEWKAYSNSELGISFSYPSEWGNAISAKAITFSKNPNVNGRVVANQNLKQKCPTPKTIINNSFCRLFTNDTEYLYESIAIVGSSLEQKAVVGKFELKQIFPELYTLGSVDSSIYLQSILDRTLSDSETLQKINTFEKMMLTLQVF